MWFRDRRTGRVREVVSESKKARVFAQSPRWELLDGKPGDADDPLAALTVAQLTEMLNTAGVEIPKGARKYRLVELARDAGLNVPVTEDEA